MTPKFISAEEAAIITGKHPASEERLVELRAYADERIREAAQAGGSKILDLMRGFPGEITQSESHRLTGSLKASGFDASGLYRRSRHDRDVLPTCVIDIYW